MSPRQNNIEKMYKNLWESHFHEKGDGILNVKVAYYPYTTLKNTIRRRGDTIFIRVSDMLVGAPLSVDLALGIILFFRLEGAHPPKSEEIIYKEYIHSREIQKRIQRIRKERGKKIIFGSKGEFYDLEESFDRVNRDYFKGKLKKPILTWSQIKTTTRFGHHDKAHNTIVISKTLDDKMVPQFLLDYVMYHEALHIKHGIHYKNGRRSMHSRAFNLDEERFKKQKEAKAMLKKISGRSVLFD